jgi:hypothetical protein
MEGAGGYQPPLARTCQIQPVFYFEFMAGVFPKGLVRGMPNWRKAQLELPLAEKIALVGRLIQETRRTEALKHACKKSAKSLKVL